MIPLIKEVDWSETKYVLGVFGLQSDILLRRLGELASPGGSAPVWRIIGVGSVAEHVLAAAPFGGRPYRFLSGPTEPGVRASGSLGSGAKQGGPASQFIGVCQSIKGQVELMAREVEVFSPETFIRHLVNVRPFGFQPSPPRQTSVKQLPTLARDFDHVWIVAGHRQRRTGSYRNRLSISNAASRLVRSLLTSLVQWADLAAQITTEGLAAIPSLNLFGMLRLRGGWSEREALRNLLHTMLCEEALLHSADRIVVLMPGEIRTHTMEVQLGEHRYQVEVVAGARTSKSSELIGWAISVELPRGTVKEFADLCISLLAGYQWNCRGPDGDALLFENEGAAFRVWPAHDPAMVMKLTSSPAPYGRDGDIILTPHSIQPDWRRRADDMEWTLIHYSEIEGWLSDNYRSGRFGDVDDE